MRTFAPGSGSKPRAQQGPLAVLVACAVFFGWSAGPARATADVGAVRRHVATLFGPLLSKDGVSVRPVADGTVQVRMAIAPAHDQGRRTRNWRPSESRRILEKLKTVLDEQFPDTEFAVSSGIVVSDPATGARRIEDFRSLDGSAVPVPPPSADGRIDGTVAEGAPPAPEEPSARSSEAEEADGPAPRASSRYPAQPGGFAKGRWPSDRSRGPTVPTSAYQYPRDNDTLEYMIEEAVSDAIRATFKDARARARIVRPQVVRLSIEVAMHGSPGENVSTILHYTRDTTLTVLKQRFNLLRVHHQSRIRVTEADDRFTYDFRFHELTPYGEQDRGDDDLLFRAIRAERAWMMDLPRAFTLGRNSSAFSVGATGRRVSPGLYSNVNTSRSAAGWFTLRHGFFAGLETSISYYTYSNSITPTAPGIFTSPPGSLSVASFGVKYLLPYQLNGLTLAIGLTQGFQPGAERRYYLPDDFERLYNVYVVGSRPIFDNLLLHLAVKRTAIPQKPDFADSSILSVGLGLEYVLADRAILMLEAKHDRYQDGTLGYYGTILDGEGLNVNGGVVFGTTLGDIEVSARKLTVPVQKEITVGISYRW